jgi:hypothetical protein
MRALMVGVLILFSLPALAPAFCRRRLPLPRLRLQGSQLARP